MAHNDTKLFKEVKFEFEEYMENANLHDLLSEITQACFESRAKDLKRFIANFCSMSINPSMSDDKHKYKNKYKKVKEAVALLTEQLKELRIEMAAVKKKLEESRNLNRDGPKARSRGRPKKTPTPQSLSESNNSD